MGWPAMAAARLGGVGVRQAVEAVATQPPLRVPLGRQGVGRCGRRQGVVERRVEAGDRSHRRQQLADGPQSRERAGLVQRRKLGQRGELPNELDVDPGWAGVPGAAVDDAVSNRIDRAGLVEEVVQRG